MSKVLRAGNLLRAGVFTMRVGFRSPLLRFINIRHGLPFFWISLIWEGPWNSQKDLKRIITDHRLFVSILLFS